jgi:hypothetical protein
LTQANNINGYLNIGGTPGNVRDITLFDIGPNGGQVVNFPLLSNLRNLTVTVNVDAPVPEMTLHNGGSLYVDTSGALTGGIGGSITQTGVGVVPGTTTLIAGSHPITFTENNSLTGAVTLSNTGNNTVAVTNSTALTLGNVSVGTGALTLNGVGILQAADTTITQASGAGNASFTANAGVIDLGNTGNSFTGPVLLNNTGVNDVTVSNNSALTIGLSTLGNGNLNLTAGGTISQSDTITQEANAGITTFTFTAPSSDLLWASYPNNLNGYLNIGGDLSSLRDVAFRNIGAGGAALINLQALSNLRNLTILLDNTAAVTLPALILHAGGNLLLDTSGDLSNGTGGSIAQTGALVVPGTTTLNAGANPITFTDTGNSFTGAVTLTNRGANEVALTNSMALTLGNVSVGTGALTLNGAGISQALGTTITQASGAGNASFTSSNGAIAITNTDNRFTGSVLLSTLGNDNASLTNSGAITLGTTTVGGYMSITAGGTMSQSGLITIANGGAIFDLTAPNSDLLFLSFPNNFGPVPIQGNPADFGNVRDIAIQTSGTTDISSALSYLPNLRNLTIIFDTASNVSFPGFSLSGNLNVTANGSITETGAINVTGGTTTVAVTAPNSDILLGSQANNFGTNSMIFGGTQNNIRDFALRNINSGATTPTLSGLTHLRNLTLSYDVAPIVVPTVTLSGNLILTAHGSITQSGTIIAPSATRTYSITLANSDILFNTQPNDLGTTPAIFAGTLNNIRDLGVWNVNLGATSSLPSFVGLTNLRNLSIAFNNAAVTLPTITLTNGGYLSVIAGGPISQTGVLTVPGTSSFVADANPITLTQAANRFTGAVAFSNSGANDVTLTNSIALILGDISVGTGALTLNGVGISQASDTVITQASEAGNASFMGNAGVINLGNVGNRFTGTVSLNNSGDNFVQLTNGGALILGASTVGSSTLGLTAGGTISETGAIVQAANAGDVIFNLTAPNSDILLANEPNNFSGSITYTGNLGNVRDVARRNINPDAAVTATDIPLLTHLRNVTYIFDNAGVVFPSSYTLHNGGSLIIDTSGNLSGGTGGSITQLGPVVIPGVMTLNAGANPIILTHTGNSFTGAVTLTNRGANDVELTNSTTLTLGNVSVGAGALALNGVGISQVAGTTITQANGAGNASFTANAGVINLGNTGNSFTGPVLLNNTGANDVQLTNSLALIMGTSNIGSGNVTLTSGGSISETGPITTETSDNLITFSFTTPSSDLLLTQANNINGYLNIGGTPGNVRDITLFDIGPNGGQVVNFPLLSNLRNLTVTINTDAPVPEMT